MKVFVRAGAGAGKTTDLISQVVNQALDFKQTCGRWPRIVLTTFTRKATEELKERLLIHSFREQRQALEFVQSKSFLNITTMHGLFYTFLTRYGRVMGLPGEFQIVDGIQADFWRRQILRDLLILGRVPDFLGSFGFSRLLNSLREFETIYWSQLYRPLELQDFKILYCDQCQKIAGSLKEFMDEVSSDLITEKWREYWKNLEELIEQLKSSGEITGPKEWKTYFNNLIAFRENLKRPRKSKNNPGLSDEQKEKLEKILKTLNDFLEKDEFDPKYWPEIANRLREFNEFAHAFTDRLIARKKQEAALEPNDLEFFSLYLIKKHPEKVKGFSGDVDIWFIDEFQDTSPLQLGILEALIDDKPYYLVGDPLQSIYFFRGARSGVFINKQQRVLRSGGEVRNLSKNYRSQADLVKFFNDFFSGIFGGQKSLVDKNPGNFNGEQAKQENPGYGGYSVMESFKAGNTGVAIEVSEIDSEEELSEVHHISRQISGLLKGGFNPRDLCILTRTHDGVDKVQRELSRLGFPVISHGHGQFFKRREILDAMGLLKFLLNPWDDENLILLLRSPRVGLSDGELVDVIGDERVSFWSLFENFFRDKKNLKSGQILCRALKDKKRFGVGWCFRKALIDLGFLDFSFQRDSTGRVEANLWKLINLVEKKSREPGQSLLKLVSEGFQSTGGLESFGDVSEAHSSVEPDKIHLMTIHASKGLEFKCVFMPFLHKALPVSIFQDLSIHEERGLWSLRLELGEFGEFNGGIVERLVMDQKREREREEFLRVLYVAMTRAEDRLFLSWGKNPGGKSWAFKIRDFIEKKSSFSEKINWSVVNPEEAVRYSSSKKIGKIRPSYRDMANAKEKV